MNAIQITLRIGVSILLIGTIGTAPWWLTLGAMIFALIMFEWYEMILVALAMDALFGGSTLFGVSSDFFITALTILVALSIPLMRHTFFILK